MWRILYLVTRFKFFSILNSNKLVGIFIGNMSVYLNGVEFVLDTSDKARTDNYLVKAQDGKEYSRWGLKLNCKVLKFTTVSGVCASLRVL